jgi:hypothetical protein
MTISSRKYDGRVGLILNVFSLNKLGLSCAKLRINGGQYQIV